VPQPADPGRESNALNPLDGSSRAVILGGNQTIDRRRRAGGERYGSVKIT
jgi:hypothetical protein